MAHAARLSALALLLGAPLGGCGETPAALALGAVLPGVAVPGSALPAPAPALPEGGPALVLLGPRRAVLLPASGSGARRIWRGEDNIALATEGARVVATAGLPRMVMATRFDGPDPLEDPRALLGREAAARRTLDLAGPGRDPAAMRFGVALDCTLAGRMEAGWLLVEERCTGEGLAFTNRFQADPRSGAVRRSTQWAGEGIGPLEIQVEP